MSVEYKITTYQSGYRNAFRVLNLEWIEKYFKVEKKDLEQLNDPESCLRDGGQIFFVTAQSREGADEVVGTCALYRIKDLKNNRQYEVAKMAVRPDHHGKGLGDLLMIEAEGWAISQNATELVILSNTSLVPAIALYKKHGFEVTHLGSHADYERGNIELRKKIFKD